MDLEIHNRLEKLQDNIDTLNFLLKKRDNIIAKNCPEKIVGENSVILGFDLFKKIYNKNPELFKDFEQYDTGDINKIYETNSKSLDFKTVLYKHKYD